MQPPASFLVDDDKKFNLHVINNIINEKITIENITIENITIKELESIKLIPFMTFVVFPDKPVSILTEAILLNVFDTKEAFDKAIKTHANHSMRMLLHLKVQSVGYYAQDMIWTLMCRDKNNRPISIKMIAQNNHMNYFEELKSSCIVMEYDSQNGIIGFLYNTSKNKKMGKPSWV